MKVKKIVSLALATCLLTANIGAPVYAATSQAVEGYTTGGGFGRSKITSNIKGNDRLVSNDDATASTQSSEKIKVSTSVTIYWMVGPDAVSKTASSGVKLTTDKVSVSVTAGRKDAYKATSYHKATSNDYGSYAFSLGSWYN